MTAGIAATGAAVFNIVEHAGEPLSAGVHWLLVGAVALALICIALLMQSIQIRQEQFQLYRRGGHDYRWFCFAHPAVGYP